MAGQYDFEDVTVDVHNIALGDSVGFATVNESMLEPFWAVFSRYVLPDFVQCRNTVFNSLIYDLRFIISSDTNPLQHEPDQLGKIRSEIVDLSKILQKVDSQLLLIADGSIPSTQSLVSPGRSASGTDSGAAAVQIAFDYALGRVMGELITEPHHLQSLILWATGAASGGAGYRQSALPQIIQSVHTIFVSICRVIRAGNLMTIYGMPLRCTPNFAGFTWKELTGNIDSDARDKVAKNRDHFPVIATDIECFHAVATLEGLAAWCRNNGQTMDFLVDFDRLGGLPFSEAAGVAGIV